MLNIALPKGRLGDKVYDMFEAAGFPCPDIRDNSRRLIFENPAEDLRFFAVKPMDVDDAITQMELLGHDFFLFMNAETDALNVLYRRNDGSYGLLVPEN